MTVVNYGNFIIVVSLGSLFFINSNHVCVFSNQIFATQPVKMTTLESEFSLTTMRTSS